MRPVVSRYVVAKCKNGSGYAVVFGILQEQVHRSSSPLARDALKRVDERVTAAIIDPRLREGETAEDCYKLQSRGIPFIIITGFPDVGPTYTAGVVITKPASVDRLIAELARLLGLS